MGSYLPQPNMAIFLQKVLIKNRHVSLKPKEKRKPIESLEEKCDN